ncbi:MAG TPA: fructose-bisphosphate aldolase, partial [Thermoanaerobaculia bacterium]|nr:fructose-bisphosphate aldolase [Thermoanaerobaculia bacterium]
MSMLKQIRKLLGSEAEGLLTHTCQGIPKQRLTLPGPDHVGTVFGPSDRSPQVMVQLERLHGTGRLANTGYL